MTSDNENTPRRKKLPKRDSAPSLADVEEKIDTSMLEKLKMLAPEDSVKKALGAKGGLCFQVRGVEDAQILRTELGVIYGMPVTSRGPNATYMTPTSFTAEPTLAQLCKTLSHPEVLRLMSRVPAQGSNDSQEL